MLGNYLILYWKAPFGCHVERRWRGARSGSRKWESLRNEGDLGRQMWPGADDGCFPWPALSQAPDVQSHWSAGSSKARRGNHRTGSSSSLPLNTKFVGNLRPVSISKAKPQDTLGGPKAVGCDWNIDYLERFGER